MFYCCYCCLTKKKSYRIGLYKAQFNGMAILPYFIITLLLLLLLVVVVIVVVSYIQCTDVAQFLFLFSFNFLHCFFLIYVVAV